MITPNNFFDEIFCINLKKRNDKWQRVNERFKREKIFVTRWEGIDGAKAKFNRKFEDYKYEHTTCKIKYPGSYAIIKTYIELLEYAYYNYKNTILIFQDDVLFHKDFKILFNNFVRNNEYDWDMWYLGASQYDMEKIKGNYIHDDSCYLADNTAGLFATAFKIDFIPAIVKILKLKIWSADYSISRFLQTKENKIKVSYPFICHHEYGYSDNYLMNIDKENTKEKKWKHRYYDENLYS